MGAFGLVWCVATATSKGPLSQNWLLTDLQLCQRSAHRASRCCQEDYETLQHSCPVKAHLPRAEAAEASQARKRTPIPPDSMLSLALRRRSRALTLSQVISLSDIFISPLEDMYVGKSTLATNMAYFLLTVIL